MLQTQALMWSGLEWVAATTAVAQHSERWPERLKFAVMESVAPRPE